MTAGRKKILTALAKYRYLRTEHIHQLIGNTCRQTTRVQLRTLYDVKLINRPPERLRGYSSLYTSEIYELEPAGLKWLYDSGIEVDPVTNLYRKKGDGPSKNFAHAMMICDTLASLEIGARQAGIEFIPYSKIIEGKGDNPLKLPISISYNKEKLNTFLVPDGLFGLRYQDGKTAYFALEAEHYNPIRPTTIKRASTLKKLLGYRDIVKQQVYRTQLGIGNLRVLVVAPTVARTTHQVELLEELTGKSHLFLFHPVPVQEEIHGTVPPFPELFTATWAQAGLPGVRIDVPT